MADEDLVALATREMQILGLLDPAKVKGGAVVRQEKAYPVYDETYAANVAAMRPRVLFILVVSSLVYGHMRRVLAWAKAGSG